MDVDEKVVLVTFGERRDIKFRTSANPEEEILSLLAAVEETFADVLSGMSSHFVQLRSERWQEYIDLRDKIVPNRAVLRLCRKEDEVSEVTSCISIHVCVMH